MLKLALTYDFWFASVTFVFAVLQIAALYFIKKISRKWLLVHGIILVFGSAAMHGGFASTLSKVQYLMQHPHQDASSIDIWVLAFLQVGLFYIQFMIPLSVAAIGSFFITKAIESGFEVEG
jgi:hypothetical protein